MFWNIVIAVAAFALQLLLIPKPQNAKPQSLDDVEAPTAEEGIEIPVLFGTRLIKGPNVVWFGDFRARAIKGPRRYGFIGPRATVGHRYYLGMHMVMCHGPADYLYEIIVGEDKLLFKGNVTGGQIAVSKRNINGEGAGGISGRVDIEMGAPDQDQNDYLADRLDADVPAFRGVVGVVLRRVELGQSTYIQPWSFIFQRIHKTSDGSEQWYDEKAAIGVAGTFEPEVDQIPNPSAGSMFLTPQDIYNGYLVVPTNGGCVAYKYPNYNSRVWSVTGLPSTSQGCCIGDETNTVFIVHQQNNNIVMLDLRTGALKGIAPLLSTPTQMVANSGISSITYEDPEAIETLGDTKLTFVFAFRGNRLWMAQYEGEGNLTSMGYVTPGLSYLTSCSEWTISPTRIYLAQGGTSGPSHNVRIVSHSPDGLGTVENVAVAGLLGTGINFIVYHKDVDCVFIHDNGGGIHAYTPDLTTKLYSNTQAGSALNQYTISGRRRIDQYGRIVYRTTRTGATNYLVAYNPGDLSMSYNIYMNTIYDPVNSAYSASAVDPLKDIVIIGGSSGIALLRVMDAPPFDDFLDMNPAHIIRECLTDKNWGMGYNSDDIDEESFMAAADTLFDEGFGLSMLWNREEEIQNFVSVVISHIDAVVYVSRRTGKFVLKLIRDDYDIDTIPVVTEADISDWDEVNRRQPAEAINSVIVKYWDRYKRDEASHSIHNTAQIQQLGKMVATTRQYPGITRPQLAIRVGLRDLKSLGIGFISGRFQSKRTLSDLNPGDPFRLVSDEHELSGQVMRVVDMNLGDGRDNKINVKFTEDIFDLGDDVILDPASSDWENPHNPPQPVEIQLTQEMPYAEMIKFIGFTDATVALTDDPYAGLFQVAAGSPVDGSINALIAVDPDTGTYEGSEEYVEFCPTAVLNTDITALQTSIVIRDSVDLDSVATGTLAVLGDEIIRIDSIVGSTVTIGRGCLDTVPVTHLEGESIIFYDNFSESDFNGYTLDQNVGIKLLTVSGLGTLSLYEASESRVIFVGRAIKPLRPADVKIEGDPIGPVDAEMLTELNVTWKNRNRLTEDSPLSWVDATVDPEDGQTTTIEVLALDGVTVITTVDGLSGTSYALPIGAFGGDNAGIVRVYSERDGHRSLTHWDITVFVNSGYGYGYGYNYGGA